MKIVTIYSKPGCPYCSRAKALLANHGVQFDEIEASDDARERIRELAGLNEDARVTWPQVIVGEVLIGGSDDLAEALKNGTFDAIYKS